jgi:predicted lipoprotein
MKKTFKNVMMLVATMTLSLGFASCSDDNDGPSTGNDIVPSAELSAVANTYVNDVVYPTYQALRDNCKTLHEACAKLYTNAKAGNLTNADVEAACEAFKKRWLYSAFTLICFIG